MQDDNAKSISSANSTERYVSKSKSAYKNDSWDLVERSKSDTLIYSKLSTAELPDELKGKSKAEIKEIVAAKSRERDSLQRNMAALGKKRQQFIDDAAKRSGTSDDLGSAINQSILQLAATKGYTAEK